MGLLRPNTSHLGIEGQLALMFSMSLSVLQGTQKSLAVPTTRLLRAHLRTSNRGSTVRRTEIRNLNSSALGSVTPGGARDSLIHAKTTIRELHPPMARTSVQSKEKIPGLASCARRAVEGVEELGTGFGGFATAGFDGASRGLAMPDTRRVGSWRRLRVARGGRVHLD